MADTRPATNEEAEAYWLTWYAGAEPEEKAALEKVSQATKNRLLAAELARLTLRPWNKLAPGERATWALLAAHRLDYMLGAGARPTYPRAP